MNNPTAFHQNPPPMSNKLTPEADAKLHKIAADSLTEFNDTSYTLGLDVGMTKALTDPALLQAQGLYTREEVRQMIADAFDAGHDRTLPGKHYAERLLPSQPKTNTNEQ